MISFGQLAAIHDGTLYVHGGVIGSGAVTCVGCVPDRDEEVEDVAEWVMALNEWKSAQVTAVTAATAVMAVNSSNRTKPAVPAVTGSNSGCDGRRDTLVGRA